MSKAIQLFNGLNGTIATRNEVNDIISLANKEEQMHISEKLQTLLDSYDSKKFDITLRENAVEIVPASMLNGLDFDYFDEEQTTGLNKAVSPNDIYQMITDKMLAMIKEASGKGYITKWKGKKYGKGYLIPFNFDSKKRYRGVNNFLLTNFDEPLKNPFFLTFKQIEKHGGKLKKGSKGQPVVYFTNLYKIVDSEKGIDFGTYNFDKAKQFAKENNISERDIQTFPILKYYNVFNGNDIDGIDFDLDNFKVGYIERELPATETLPIPEAIIKNYPAPKPPLKHGGNRAYYSPMSDYIKMPHIADFDTIQDYYRTLFHEFAHSTGNHNRLKRDFTGRFGSKKYAFEELIAEWGATFLSAEAGIIFHNNKNHAEYIKNWNAALTHIKDDNRFIMRACTKAQELCDFILQFDKDGNPKYLKDIEVSEDKKTSAKSKKRVQKTVVKKNGVQLDIYNHLKAKNYKDFKKRIEFLQGYLDIEEKQNKIASKLMHFQDIEDEKNAKIYNKEYNKLEKSLQLQVVTGAKYFGVSENDFINAINLYSEDKTLYKKSTLNNVSELTTEEKADYLGVKVDKDGQIGLFGTAKDKETISFNKEVLKAKKTRKFDERKVYNLGKTKDKLKSVIGNFTISVSGAALNKAMTKDSDHIATFEHFINLPDSINIPLAIFKSDTERNAFVVLTELKNRKQKPIIVAIHINESFKISKIASIYSKTKKSIFTTWYNKGLMIYPTKKPFSSLLSALIAVSQTTKRHNKYTKKSNSPTQKKKKGLSEPVVNEVSETVKPKPVTNSKAKSIRNIGQTESEFFTVNGEVGVFLQAVERKPKESVVITMDGEQGAGKTTTLYKFMDAFASAGNSSLFLSLEEHHESSLAVEKRDAYLSDAAQDNLAILSEVATKEELYQEIENYDIIFLDSWQKLQRMIGQIRLDEDLRKKFDGKVFVIIFQQTTTGRTKGGSEVVYDGDIIIKMVKENSFSYNYAYFDKNRYTKVPIETIRYNIASGKVYNPQATETQPEEIAIEPVAEIEPIEFSFEIS